MDKFLLGNDTVNTNIATTPYSPDLSPWITWTDPSLSNGTSLIEWTSLRYPSDLQTGLDTTITFRWSKVPDVTRYLVQISSDAEFTALEKSDSTGSDTLKTFTGLLKGRQYFWRVKAQSVAGVGLWSNVWRFVTTTSPAKTQLLEATPVQDQPGYARYTWHKVQDADQYAIRVTAMVSPNRPFKSGSTSDTVMTFSGHSEGGEYEWQVQAGNIAGSGPWSDVSRFTFTVTDVQEDGETPAEYSIGQNYPNPFNPTTTIPFALPQTGRTTITVYDLLGRGVKTLINRSWKPAITKSVSMQALSQAGSISTKSNPEGFVKRRKWIL